MQDNKIIVGGSYFENTKISIREGQQLKEIGSFSNSS